MALTKSYHFVPPIAMALLWDSWFRVFFGLDEIVLSSFYCVVSKAKLLLTKDDDDDKEEEEEEVEQRKTTMNIICYFALNVGDYSDSAILSTGNK